LRSLDEICHVNFNEGFHSQSERAATTDQQGKEGLIEEERWYTKHATRQKSQPMQHILGKRVYTHVKRKQEHCLCFLGDCLLKNG